jgi:pullulanase
VNCLKWDTLDDPEYKANLDFYKGLISFRKAHGLLRLSTTDEVEKRVTAVEGLDKNVVAFNLDNTDKGVAGEEAENIFLAFNPNETETSVQLPEGNWSICAKGIQAGTESLGTASGTITIAPVSAVILTKGDSIASKASANGVNKGVIGGVVAASAAGAAALLAFTLSRKKKKQ